MVDTSKKQKLIVEAEPDLVAAVKAQADTEDRSMSALIRFVLRKYLKDKGHKL